jgi:hypothetical protein
MDATELLKLHAQGIAGGAFSEPVKIRTRHTTGGFSSEWSPDIPALVEREKVETDLTAGFTAAARQTVIHVFIEKAEVSAKASLSGFVLGRDQFLYAGEEWTIVDILNETPAAWSLYCVLG